MQNGYKFFILFCLYIAQSVPMSFFSTVVPVIMRQENYSLELIGLIQLVKLPWIAKFLWAPLVDKKALNVGHYFKWIVYSELFYAVVVLSISFFNLQTDFVTIIVLMVIAFMASATQDIATDAFAIFILKVKERSLGNSMQSAGSFVGTLLGSGLLLIIYHYFGWQILLLALAVFVLVAVVPLMFYRHDKAAAQSRQSNIRLKDILLFFKSPRMLRHSLLLAFFYSGIIGILAMLKPLLVDAGYSTKEIGFMSGIFGTAVAALSALLSGLIIRFVGLHRAMFIYIGISFLAGLYFWLVPIQYTEKMHAYGGIFAVWLAYGLSTVAVYTSAMNAVRQGREGTDFTIQIVLTHLSSLIIAVLSGKAAGAYSYSFLFTAEMLLSLLTFGILLYVLPRRRTLEQDKRQ